MPIVLFMLSSLEMLLLQLRMARAAANAYEMLEEYLEEAGDHLKALNPLRTKEKKINLLTDSDDEEEEEVCYYGNKTLDHVIHSIYRLGLWRG